MTGDALTPIKRYWYTASGLVYSNGTGVAAGSLESGISKVHCYRARTHGYHGLLRVDLLEPATEKSPRVKGGRR